MNSILFLATFAASASAPLAADNGATIYKNQCARCHGANGEGAKKYQKPLVGDLSVSQLAKLVRETMPEDNPGSLSEADALAVSDFVHSNFYSVIARDRAKPARIDLARLTIKQYRAAIADVMGSFRSPPTWGPERGLAAEYFSGRNIQRDKRVLSRNDAEVDFDFGTTAPVAGKMQNHEFCITWSGSLMPPDSGEYEFVIRTEHATRLWVNDMEHTRPLIDAWVKSGSTTEFTGTTHLLAGRPVSIRLEYAKAKQGVDDSNSQKKPPPPVKSSIRLLWRRPNSVPEIIPGRALSPKATSEQYVVTAKFPPDDRSLGWERGSSVSKEWDAAVTDGAIETASYVLKRLNQLANVKDDDKERSKKLQAFCATFAERAFRRPLTAEQRTIMIDHQFATTKTAEEAVKRVVLLTLKSPFFLYREAGGGTDQFDAAARLSFALWDSIPDQKLLTAAGKGELKTREQLAQQAERMLRDPRASAKLRMFLLTWLHADQPKDLLKDAKRFPQFDSATIADLKSSLEIFLDEVIASDASDFRQLMLSEDVYMNARMAKFYGGIVPTDAGFVKMKLDEGKRGGVLTHPYLMTMFSSPAESSPIHRGVFLARGVLGQMLRPPPEAIAPIPPDLNPGMTTRERVTMQTKPASCMTCHSVINPLGYTLEHFDAVGRFRERDAGKPINDMGEYLLRTGKTREVQGARDLARFLAESDESQGAFVEQMFHHLVQQPVRAYGANRHDELKASFRKNAFHIRKLAVEIATVAATPTTLTTQTTPKSATPTKKE
ncbi:MAG: DUF1592 domain-containing protein [Gemmataceae bacterium]